MTTISSLFLRAISLLILLLCVLQIGSAQLVSADSVQQTIHKNFRATDSTVVHLKVDGDLEILYGEVSSIEVEAQYFRWTRYIGRFGRETPFALLVTESGDRIEIQPAERRSPVLFIGLRSKTKLTYRVSLPPWVPLTVEMIKEGNVTVVGGAGAINELRIITHVSALQIDVHQANFKSFDVVRLRN